jgi:hypothetical protein
MNIKTSSARRMALSVLTAGALAAGVAGASSASAAIIKTGYGRVNFQGLAIGTNIDATTGVAADKATFTWKLKGGVTQVNVSGEFSAVGRSGVPVEVALHYYTGRNANGSLVSSNSTLGVTPASDGAGPPGPQLDPGGRHRRPVGQGLHRQRRRQGQHLHGRTVHHHLAVTRG